MTKKLTERQVSNYKRKFNEMMAMLDRITTAKELDEFIDEFDRIFDHKFLNDYLDYDTYYATSFDAIMKKQEEVGIYFSPEVEEAFKHYGL